MLIGKPTKTWARLTALMCKNLASDGVHAQRRSRRCTCAFLLADLASNSNHALLIHGLVVSLHGIAICCQSQESARKIADSVFPILAANGRGWHRHGWAMRECGFINTTVQEWQVLANDAALRHMNGSQITPCEFYQQAGKHRLN